MDKSVSVLLGLLRVTLGYPYRGEDVASLSADDWSRFVDLAYDQGVAALAADGYCDLQIESLVDSNELEDLRYEWFGDVFQSEEEYEDKFRKTARFAAALQRHGIKCRVLKGMAFAGYYTHPEHRVCGDSDVYLGDGWQQGNEIAVRIGGRYEFGTYKHSHIFFGHLLVENHRYLTDFGGTRQGRRIELLLERVISEGDGPFIGDSCLICPNDRFNALLLLKHAHGNFLSGGLIIRMLYDWAALLKCCQDTMDWKRLYSELSECRLREFARLMTSLCVDYLGTELTCQDVEQCGDKTLVAEVMEDTIGGGIYTKGKETFPKKCVRIARRFLRFWRYRDLATESFPRLIWNNFAFSSYMKRRIEM